MKITIIGYKNHALRLKSILNKLGYDNVVNYNYHTDSLEDMKLINSTWYHTDSLEDSDVYFISSPKLFLISLDELSSLLELSA